MVTRSTVHRPPRPLDGRHSALLSASYTAAGGGGGTGLFGSTSNGTRGTTTSIGGKGGSGGSDAVGSDGGWPGGGAGGIIGKADKLPAGAGGACRLLWGPGRGYQLRKPDRASPVQLADLAPYPGLIPYSNPAPSPPPASPPPTPPPSPPPSSPPTGEMMFNTSGTFTWTPPAGVANVSVACVGAGGGAASFNTAAGGGGGSGGGGEPGHHRLGLLYALGDSPQIHTWAVLDDGQPIMLIHCNQWQVTLFMQA
jgi:hypothetical protein